MNEEKIAAVQKLRKLLKNKKIKDQVKEYRDKNNNGGGIVHIAARYANQLVCEEICKSEIELIRRDDDGYQPIAISIECERWENVMVFQRYISLKDLLDIDEYQNSVYHHMSQYESEEETFREIMQMLEESEEMVNSKNRIGQTAREIARMREELKLDKNRIDGG